MTAADVAHETPTARRTLRDAVPLLAAVGLLMAGNGLTGTLLGVRAGIEGFGATVTGGVLAGYYLGFLGGSLLTPSTISRVGHVRVFAGLASLASAAVLIHVVRPEPFSWFLLRAVSGLCISGLYVVTETWLNGAATNTTRGSLLAAYMVVVTGGLGVGQLLFSVADPGGFAAFVLASVLVSLAVVPVSLATVRPPEVPEPQRLTLRELVAIAPLGPVGASLSGFTGAAMVGAGAIYATEAGLGRAGTSLLIASALVGGLVLQAPLGRWSDATDRRLVIVATGVLGAVAAVAAALIGPDHRLPLVAATLVAGGVAFPLYSLSSAHLNDWLESGRVVAAGAKMVLVNGAGAVAGPIVAAAAIDGAGPGALFVVMAAGYVAVAIYAAWRITRRAAPPEEERATYVPLPAAAAPTIATLQEGVGDELYPVEDGVVEVDGRRIGYREQGTEQPVVLVHDPSDTTSVWDGVLPALAADGVRAIAPEISGPELAIEDLLALLRHLELPEVVFVGVGAGADIVARFTEEHPDRVHTVVAVDHPTLHVDDPDGFADRVVEELRHPGADDRDERD